MYEGSNSEIIDRILSNTLRSSSVSLKANLLDASPHSFQLSCLHIASSILLGVIALSFGLALWRPERTATIPSGYRLPAMWFESITLLITIRPSITRYQLTPHLNLDILPSLEPVVGTSTNPLGNAYRLLNPSCR